MSGAELAVKEITNRIVPGDIEFHMVTLRFSPSDAVEEKVGNILVHRIGYKASYVSKILFIPRAAVAAARLHKTQKFDALWALMSYMVLPVELLRLGGVKLPYVLTLQDGDPFEHVFDRPHIRPFKPLLQAGFRNASVVQVISTYLGGWAKKMGFTGPIEVVPNGVDTITFSQKVEPSLFANLSLRVGKKDGEVWLVTTSRLVEKNATDVTIRALALLPLHIHFLILGTGKDEQALRKLAKSLAVAERVHFMGQIENSDLPGYLQVCDIFVRPSRSEGMGSSFIEAFAAGVPVVATQEGGIADFLFDATRNPGKAPTGFAVDKDSPEQIAKVVLAILGNPEARNQVVENARSLASLGYDWDAITIAMQKNVFAPLLK
jgi:glycosyltransferase involved in cell wall biosynthesis